jgi:glutamate synthase domain-containing protein 3
MVDLEQVASEAEQQGRLARELWHRGHSDEAILKRLVENHAKYTESRRAKEVLAGWAVYRAKFVKVFPKEYRRALAENAAASRKAVA